MFIPYAREDKTDFQHIYDPTPTDFSRNHSCKNPWAKLVQLWTFWKQN